MAVSPAPVGSQVLAGCSGRTLYLILPNKVQDAVTRRLPSSCMSLSWDKSANLWITAASGIFELTDAGGSTPTSSALVPVQIPSLRQPNVRPVKALRVAPDGVRVAMIVPSGPTSKIMIAAISHNSTSTYIAQTLGTLRVGSDLADPVALSWLDPDHLLVLNESAPGHAEIYEVPLNGGDLDGDSRTGWRHLAVGRLAEAGPAAAGGHRDRCRQAVRTPGSSSPAAA